MTRDSVIRNLDNSKLCECAFSDDCICEECDKWDGKTINPNCYERCVTTGGCMNWKCSIMKTCKEALI